MSAPGYRQQLYRVDIPFDTHCMIEFAAPYSESQTVKLPIDLVFTAYHEDSRPDVKQVDARALDAEDWAPLLIDARFRFSNNYRDYVFVIDHTALESNCTAIDTEPADKPEPLRHHQAIQGCLFGTAVGDAIGLPYEGLSSRRIQRLHAIPLKHRFFFGIGMLSDDTEHTCLVAQSLIACNGDFDGFIHALGWRLRWWFVGLPAGIGMATLKACIKLWLGFPIKSSGVYSAGNGPAMRSALLGAFAPDDVEYRIPFVTANTLITHKDPRALKGALIIAELAARNARAEPLLPDDALKALVPYIEGDEDLLERITQAIDSAANNETAMKFCERIDLDKGVSGYIYHTLPVVVQIVLRHHHNYEAAINETVACGGDTDTVAAIVGGIVGAGVGTSGIPQQWLNGLWDWPRSQRFIRLLGEELAVVSILKQPGRNQYLDIVRVWIRNLPFMFWVLAHGFRRLLPPY